MRTKLSREERLKAIEKRMNRRDFARFTALGAVAAMISRRAYSEIPLGDLTNPSKPALYVGHSCANILTKIGDKTVEDIVYAPLSGLLIALQDGFGKATPTGRLLESLHLAVLAADRGQNGPPLTYGDLCMFDEFHVPRKGMDTTLWEKVYGACRGVEGTTILREEVSMPFLEMAPNAAPQRQRERIATLLTGAKSGFKAKVGFRKYVSLFTKGYKDEFSTDRMGKPQPFDFEGFVLARSAFTLGVFGFVGLSSGGAKPKIGNPNGKCYSVAAEDCVLTNQTSYCAIDSATGQPTSSTDFCP